MATNLSVDVKLLDKAPEIVAHRIMTASTMMTPEQSFFAHVIEAYAELAGVSLREAFDVFYTSNVYREIRDGISDMHCRSDGYLAEELRLEVNDFKQLKTTY